MRRRRLIFHSISPHPSAPHPTHFCHPDRRSARMDWHHHTGMSQWNFGYTMLFDMVSISSALLPKAGRWYLIFCAKASYQTMNQNSLCASACTHTLRVALG